jgi:hypothetical protein
MQQLEFRVQGLLSEQLDTTRDQPSCSKTQLARALSERRSSSV